MTAKRKTKRPAKPSKLSKLINEHAELQFDHADLQRRYDGVVGTAGETGRSNAKLRTEADQSHNRAVRAEQRLTELRATLLEYPLLQLNASTASASEADWERLIELQRRIADTPTTFPVPPTAKRASRNIAAASSAGAVCPPWSH